MSHALWTSHHRTPPVETKLELNSPLQQEREVLEALNERVQAQIKTFNGKDLDLISLEHSNFDIERVIWRTRSYSLGSYKCFDTVSIREAWYISSLKGRFS